MNHCIFCSVVEKNIPHHEVWWENENHIAFLDINPMYKGHTLVIPKKHSNKLSELDLDEYKDLFVAVREVSEKLKNIINSDRVALVFDGFSISHTHIHLIPVNKHGDLSSANRYVLAEGELKEIGDLLRCGK